MGRKEAVAKRLRNMEQVRQKAVTLKRELKILEEALQMLSPEERLVAEFLLINPQQGNVQRLCEILQVEQSSIYRKKEKVLEKIAEAILS